MTRARFLTQPPPGFWKESRDTLKTVGAAVAIAVAFQTAIFQPFTIPSSSMEPGLVTGDYLIASKSAYGWSRASLPFNPPLPNGRILGRTPTRGEVALFRLPRDPRQIWIKRIVGLPGDRIAVRDGKVFVNDQGLSQTREGRVQDHDHPAATVLQVRERQDNGRAYLTYDSGRGLPGDSAGPYVVPQGSYFVMGDHRDNSLDSRWPGEVGVGFLPAENLVGKAEIVIASWQPGAELLKPWTWLDFQPGRFFRPVH